MIFFQIAFWEVIKKIHRNFDKMQKYNNLNQFHMILILY